VSGGGNNATLTNGPTFSSYINGGVVLFDGVDDYAISALPSINSSHTVMLWIYDPNGLPTVTGDSTGRTTPLKGNGQWNPGIWLGNNKIRGHASGKYADYTSISWSAPAWHMIGQVWNGTNLTLITDGQIVTPTSTAPYSPGIPTQLLVGIEDIGTTSTAFNGYIPIVQIYNRALSQAEVTQNFNAQRARFGI
jgi:hypothetical protein